MLLHSEIHSCFVTIFEHTSHWILMWANFGYPFSQSSHKPWITLSPSHWWMFIGTKNIPSTKTSELFCDYTIHMIKCHHNPRWCFMCIPHGASPAIMNTWSKSVPYGCTVANILAFNLCWQPSPSIFHSTFCSSNNCLSFHQLPLLSLWWFHHTLGHIWWQERVGAGYHTSHWAVGIVLWLVCFLLRFLFWGAWCIISGHWDWFVPRFRLKFTKDERKANQVRIKVKFSFVTFSSEFQIYSIPWSYYSSW